MTYDPFQAYAAAINPVAAWNPLTAYQGNPQSILLGQPGYTGGTNYGGFNPQLQFNPQINPQVVPQFQPAGHSPIQPASTNTRRSTRKATLWQNPLLLAGFAAWQIRSIIRLRHNKSRSAANWLSKSSLSR